MDALKGEPLRSFGPFVLDCTRRTLLRNGEPVALTPKAFDILAVLTASGGQVVTKETILRTVWPDTVVDEGSLTFQISTLRKAIADGVAGADRYIATVPGRGYQLAAPVELISAEMVVEERTTAIVAITEEETQRFPRGVVLLALLVAVAAIGVFLFLRRRDSQMPTPAAAIRTLAVLPFKPLVASERDQALELGMADTLIAKISSFRGVTVRPLSAVRRFGGLEQDPIAAGRQLGVDAVLDGSVHSTANNVRVTVRLLRVADASQLWSGQFDSPFANIFAVHDAISARLVDELSFKLTEQERNRLRRRDTRNPEAYRAYLLGRFYTGRPRLDWYLKAIDFYNQAIALDPGYALAYAGLADVYSAMPIGCDSLSGPASGPAKSAALKAIALDPGIAGARTALGREKFFCEWDWKGAEDEFRRAVALDPSNPDGHRMYAHLLSNTGRHAEAVREMNEALRLDPVSFLNNALRGEFLLQAGNLDAAVAAEKRALEVDPDFWIAHLQLGKAYLQKGLNAEALEEYRVSYAHSGGSTEPLGRTGHLLARTGREAEARKVLAELMAISNTRYVPPYNIAMVHTGLGQNAEAVRWLRRACTERDVRMVFLKVEPLWNALRDEPGFADVERCVNLP